MAAPRYRFADFVISTRQRQLLNRGQPVPLIPRYFDLLVLLVEHRQAAVSRRDIFDAVWGDVIVSDGALSQAVRTLRRTLDDDPREPVYIRTVSRHGYSFVFADVVEEDDVPAPEPVASQLEPSGANQPTSPPPAGDDDAAIEHLVGRLRSPSGLRDEERRDAAEQLHALGTARALERLISTPGHSEALAIFRDARWSVPGAAVVPLLGQPEGLRAAALLVRLRLTDALRVTERRWALASAYAALAGVTAGAIGGTMLVLAPASSAPATAIGVLALVGAIAGAIGAAGVAAGMALGEALARSRRAVAIVCGGAAGGLAIGWLAHVAVRWTLEGLFGISVPVGGPVEGLCLGAAVAAGYAITTRRPGGGIATPTGRDRWRTVLAAAAAAGTTAIVLTRLGYPLVGGVLNAVAQASRGSQVAFAPLGALVGEPSFGPVTQVLVAVLEGGLFGLGLAWGLTARGRFGQP